MSAQSKREEMHRMVDGIDESKLEMAFNRMKEDLKVVGREPDGTPITIGDLKEDIKQAQIEVENGDFLTIEEAEKESLTW